MIIRCVVAAVNADGEPDLFFTKVHCTQSSYDNGEHYDEAEEQAAAQGYEPCLAFDENDAGGKALMPLCVWESIPDPAPAQKLAS